MTKCSAGNDPEPAAQIKKRLPGRRAFTQGPEAFSMPMFCKGCRAPALPRPAAGLFAARLWIGPRRTMYTDAQAAAFIHAQSDLGVFSRAGRVFQPHRLAAFTRTPRFAARTAAVKQGHPQAGLGWAGRRIQGHAIVPHGSSSFRPKQGPANSFYVSRRQRVRAC